MSFSVFTDKPVLVEQVIQAWPGARQLTGDKRAQLEQHVHAVVELTYGTPPSHSAANLLELLHSPVRLQAALDDYYDRVQTVRLWEQSLNMPPHGRLDAQKLTDALQRLFD